LVSDKKILRKYKDGRKVDPKDEVIIKELASLGLMRCGFDLDELEPTAIVTDLGRSRISYKIIW